MAVTNIHQIYSTVDKAIAYITQKHKTDEGVFVSSFCVPQTAIEAADSFSEQRAFGNGRGKILAQHIIQSFKPGEVSPEQAIAIGLKLAEEFLGNKYQYVIATHVDKGHIHNHIIFNNVDMIEHKSFETTENRGKKSYKNLRKISDKLCKQHRLSVIENPEHSRAKNAYANGTANEKSYRGELRKIINDVLQKNPKSFEDFLIKLRANGVEVSYTPDKAIRLKYKLPSSKRWIRARTLGGYYDEESIRKLIEKEKAAPQDRTKQPRIIDTTTDAMQSAKSLERWARVQNMKELMNAINRRDELLKTAPKKGGQKVQEELKKLDKIITDYQNLQQKERQSGERE